MMMADVQYLLLIALVFGLVYRQYAKVRDYEQGIFGLKRINAFRETVTALIYGIFGGFLATILFISLGVSLNDVGIAYLWMAALILMLINPRFLCFAYAGSLVSLVSLLTGYPQIQIAPLMALVAILHFVEATLIFINGYHVPSPIFLKDESGKIVGGFSLQKFWPMPTIALVGMLVTSSQLDLQSVAMPEWWPIFGPILEVPSNQALVHILFPIIVALGYSDVVKTELPKTKARRSAIHLALYSLFLLALAIFANFFPKFLLLPVLFAPLGHELIIYWSKKREKQHESIFHSDNGVMVLAVYPNSPAEKMGLDIGDVIRSINGIQTPTWQDLVSQITPWVIDPVLVVENQFRTPKKREIKFQGKLPPLGIVPTPHAGQRSYMRIKENSLRQKWMKWRSKGK